MTKTNMDELLTIREICNSIADIQYHIGVLNDEYGVIAIRLAMVENDVAWLLKFFWLLMGGVVGQLVFQFFTHRKINNGK